MAKICIIIVPRAVNAFLVHFARIERDRNNLNQTRNFGPIRDGD